MLRLAGALAGSVVLGTVAYVAREDLHSSITAGHGGPSTRARTPTEVTPTEIQSTGNIGAVRHGSKLISPYTGSPSSALNLNTNVGPNALLRSSAYPMPSDTTNVGPLTTAPAPYSSDTIWRMSPGSSGTSLFRLWAGGSSTAPYTYNNDPSNHGGVVTGSPMVIDGYTYPVGTYVFQFIDFSQLGHSTSWYPGWPTTVLRGCRMRNGNYSPGFLNIQGFDNLLALHYCEAGAPSAQYVLDNASGGYGIALAINSSLGNCSARFLRTYVSYTVFAIQVNQLTSGLTTDVIECFVEKLTYAPGAHLDSISTNGGTYAGLFLRNNVVIANPDENGNDTGQDGCLILGADSGSSNPGTGTNSDGSTGYWFANNYVGGMGYPFYLGYTGSNTVANVHLVGNRMTTRVFSRGGSFGPIAFQPVWGSNGNVQSDNQWADGPNVGTAFI